VGGVAGSSGSGWQSPPGAAPTPGGSGGPLVGWEAPSDEAGLGIGESIREGWRITRSQLGPLALLTAIPAVLINLLYLPFWVRIGSIVDGLLTFWTTVDWSRYRTDPEGLQRDLEAVMQPFQDLTIATSVATGVIVPISIVAVAAITAGTLEAMAGRRPSVRAAYTAALHRRAVIVPAIVLGLGYVAVSLPVAMLQPGYADVRFDAGRAGATFVLGILTLILEIVVIYLAVRWAFYFQVVMADDLGVRAALARSAALSAGIRMRIALVILVLALLIWVLVACVVAVPALVVGALLGSFPAALATGLVVFSITTIVYIPLFVAVITYLFGRRREDTPRD